MTQDQKFKKNKYTIIRTFDLVPKSVPTTLSTRLKVIIIQNNAFKTFDLVPKLVLTTFDLVQKILAVDALFKLQI